MSERTPTPPRLVRSLLSAALHAHDRPFALADLDEEFSERALERGTPSARWWYRRQVLASLAPALRGRFVRRARAGERGPRNAFVNSVGNDLRFGARMMVRTPMMTILTVLSLGVGLGGVTVVLAVVDALLFQPPIGIDAPSGIVSIYRTDAEGNPYGALSYADYQDVATEIGSLSGAAVASFRSVSLLADGVPTSEFMEEVSNNYFDVTGMRPHLGRAFVASDFAEGGETRLAVLGHDAWHDHFSASEAAIGSTIRVDGVAFTVVGVAPDGVKSRRVPLEPDIWIPLGSLQPSGRLSEEALIDRGQRRLRLLGRLGASSSLEMVQAEATALASRLADELPDVWAPDGTGAQAFTVVSESASRTNPRGRVMIIAAATFFLAVAGMILLLACANVAGLFVARAQRRRAEMALRASLGASRMQIVRMLVAEGVWPGILGALLGVGIASWATGLMSSAPLPVEVPIGLDVSVTPPVLAASFAVALVATLIFSLLPAVGSARADVARALREQGSGGRGKFWSVRNALVIVQCATSVVLIIGATLVVRTLSVASVTDLGFEHDRVAVATHRLPAVTAMAGDEASLSELMTLRDRLDALDGVDEVAMSSVLELTLFVTTTPLPIAVDGYQAVGGEPELVFHNAVTPGYLEMLSIPILAGRSFESADGPEATRVAVVNTSFAERYWAGLDPVGRSFTGGAGPDAVTYQVVGVSRDGKYLDFDDPPTPYFYSALYQDPRAHVAVLVKGRGEAHEHLAGLRREVVPEDGVVQMMPPSVLSDQVSIQFLHLQVLVRILGWGGLFGLFLAAIGIYGVVAFAVTQRSKEMAIRVALGAEVGNVVRSVAMDGVRLALCGLVVGVLVAIPSATLVGTLLYGVAPTDPAALGSSLGLLLAVAVGASLFPALRITRVDPMVTLRSE